MNVESNYEREGSTNPKKNKLARRKRNPLPSLGGSVQQTVYRNPATKKAYLVTRSLHSKTATCKDCALRPRATGSSRCVECVKK